MWEDFWLKGLKCIENSNYIEAKEMLENAIAKMSSEGFQESPDILINLIQVDYLLHNNGDACQRAKNLLSFYKLSDQQKLLCGSLLVGGLWSEGEHEEAVQTYFEQIVKSPLVPKLRVRNDKIIINNVPSCEAYKKFFKNFFIKEFCEKQTDFYENGDVWIIEIKKCQCNHQITGVVARMVDRRNEDLALRGCCNTCGTLAVGASASCTRIPHAVCQAGCVLFVELARQVCVECCHLGGWEACWNKFAFWKEDFYNKNPNCPDPKDWL